MKVRATTVALLMAGVALSIEAQRPLASAIALPAPKTASTGVMVASGVAGGLLGFFAGAAAGKALDRAGGRDEGCEDCIRWGAALGAGAGSALGISIGVHSANSGRGDFRSVLGRSALTIGAGWVLSYAAYRVAGEGWDMVPALAGFGAAVYVAVKTERGTTRIEARAGEKAFSGQGLEAIVQR
jgi:hypothetical protein